MNIKIYAGLLACMCLPISYTRGGGPLNLVGRFTSNRNHSYMNIVRADSARYEKGISSDFFEDPIAAFLKVASSLLNPNEKNIKFIKRAGDLDIKGFTAVFKELTGVKAKTYSPNNLTGLSLKLTAKITRDVNTLEELGTLIFECSEQEPKPTQDYVIIIDGRKKLMQYTHNPNSLEELTVLFNANNTINPVSEHTAFYQASIEESGDMSTSSLNEIGTKGTYTLYRYEHDASA